MTEKKPFLMLRNGERALLRDLPVTGFSEFRDIVLGIIKDSGRAASFFAVPGGNAHARLYAVLAKDTEGKIFIAASDVENKYTSFTNDCAQFARFEREIAEQWGIIPEGHPWLKPLRFHDCYRAGYDAWGRKSGEERLPGVTDFFRMEGTAIHEVGVGPVHAGVIEPGHFRFQCHGEHVYNLEISLGYQHRGIERALSGGPDKRTVRYMETLAGDTSIAHASAYAQAVESLSRCGIPARAQVLRGVMLELERLANHTGDLGALANDVAYLPTASYCGRLRGDFLNLTALVCGNRFGRGMVSPGGVEFDVDSVLTGELLKKLDEIFRDTAGAVNLMWDSPSCVERFERTGSLTRETAESLGIVGVAARASGIERDARFDFPSGIYRLGHIPVSTYPTGDVFARAYVRWLEAQRSVEFIKEQMSALPGDDIRVKTGRLEPDAITVSLVEGWRGEICHTVLTGPDGKFKAYKIVDPSFHNWAALEMVLRGEEISNFPLCNKSFNLSYCGHDL
ncbi:MAG: hydrogenase [Candidatus Omnitrophota bacterium]